MKKHFIKTGTCLILFLFLLTACQSSTPTADDSPVSLEIDSTPVTMVEIFNANGTEIYSYMGTSKITYQDGVKVIQLYTEMDK